MPIGGGLTTYAACLTPSGTAAIAVIAVHGPQAWSIARGLFRRAGRPDEPLPERVQAPKFWFGKLTGEAADEVVVLVRQLEPVPSLEIQCHGGQQVVALVLETLANHGVDICTWQELERIKSDSPLAAQALIALTAAVTMRTAAILLDQHQGAFVRAYTEVILQLKQGQPNQAEAILKPLVERCPLGRHLTIPWRVVIAGPPNVGKSSLVNALTGYQRSIVSPIPGTTRDVVSTAIAIDGWPIELIDTAGLHAAVEDLERQGVARARQVMAQADLCLWLFDASAFPEQPPDDVKAPLLVINKVDLPAAWPLAEAAGAIRLSARTGSGLDDLCTAISQRLVPVPPPQGAAVPFTPELCANVEGAWEALRHGRLEVCMNLLREL
jgi:tRNA modification GTPase